MISKSVINKITNSPYITRTNLEILLGSNRRVLDSRINSLLEKNILVRLKQGFYISTKHLENEPDKESYLEYLGSVLKMPSYVSLSYALAKHGLIPELVRSITYVSLKKTNILETPVSSFVYKSIKTDLFMGYREVDYGGLKYYFAWPYKALFDLFYFTKFDDKKQTSLFLEESRINWKVFDGENKINFEGLVIKSGSRKMQKVLLVMKENKII